MVTHISELTFEEFERQYAGKRYEYVDGRPLPMGIEIESENGERIVPPPKPVHALLVSAISRMLWNIIDASSTQAGKIFTEFGFIMSDDPVELRAPDVAFVSAERLQGIDLNEWLPFPPDFAVEVISEYDRAADIRRKASSYMARGTRLLWIVYPDQRIIDVYQPGQPLQTRDIEDTLTGGAVLPSLSIPVRSIFAMLDEAPE